MLAEELFYRAGGLVKLAAEAEDTTPEEYLKKKAEADELEAAKQLIAKQKGEAIRRADLEELHRLFPETSEYDDISKLPNFKRFGELRVVGLSAAEAYSASHTDTIKTSAAEKAKKNTLAGTKNHLQTSVPKGAKNDEIAMTRQELSEMREAFSDLSDAEKLINMVYYIIGDEIIGHKARVLNSKDIGFCLTI